MAQRKPTISIIGTGRLGGALAIALTRRGYPLAYLVARNRRNAKKVASLLDVPSTVLAAKELGRLKDLELIVISTPDDQLSEVVARLSQVEVDPSLKPVTLHTSGALSSAVLSPLIQKGWSVGSIHPLIAVTEPQSGADLLRGGFWCVEGQKRAVSLARMIVRDLEGKSFSLEAKYKPLYHAAAVMSSGQVVALFRVALQMLEKCGLSYKQSKQILLPLIESAVSNLTTKGEALALTGSFARGDLQTIRLHLDSLSKKEFADTAELYRLLGLQSVLLAEENGLDAKSVSEIKRELMKK